MRERGRAAYLQIDLFFEHGLWTLDKRLYAVPTYSRKKIKEKLKEASGTGSLSQKDQCCIWLTFFLVNGKMYTFSRYFCN